MPLSELWAAFKKAVTPEAKAERLAQLTEKMAKKIDGQPWWLSSGPQFIHEYRSVSEVERELPFASTNGWEIEQQSISAANALMRRPLVTWRKVR